jgi:transposase
LRQAIGDEGGQLYHPSLMLKVWLYAYALGVTSSRRLEQRIREDLAFRYLAGGARTPAAAPVIELRSIETAINCEFEASVEWLLSHGHIRCTVLQIAGA